VRTRKIALLAVLLLAGLSTACTRLADRDFIGNSLHTGSWSKGYTSSDSLVVASYNIRYGQNLDQAITDLRADPMLAAADILLLQEMDDAGTERIARELGYNFVYYAATIHPEFDQPFGNAVLSHAPISQHYFIALPVRSPFPVTSRIAVVARVGTDEESVVVVSIHTSTVAVEREVRLEQFQSVRDSMLAFEGPVVIGGDFNTPTYDDLRMLRDEMRAQDLQHALPPTPTAHVPWWQKPFDIRANLDHFFYRELKLRRNGVSTDATASDHLPVWAVFEWQTVRR